MQKNELIKMEYVILAFSKLHFNTGELTSLEDTFFYVCETLFQISVVDQILQPRREYMYTIYVLPMCWFLILCKTSHPGLTK